MRYDPIMCMMVDDSVKTQDELSLSQKKQVVTELKGFLKKSYNFSDESEYARAYEDLRHMFTTGSRKSISGLFENAVKKTGAQDAMPSDLKKAGYEVGTVEKYGSTYYTLVYNGKVISTSPTEANIVEKAKKHYANRHAKARDVAPATQRYINTIVNENKANAEKFVRQAEQDDEVPENELKYVYKAYNEKFGYKFHDSSSALDKAIRSCDEQIRLVKTISKKNGYAIHIVEGGYGERIVLTFPNESYDNPHMWLGSNNPSNIQKAKELLDKFSK